MFGHPVSLQAHFLREQIEDPFLDALGKDIVEIQTTVMALCRCILASSINFFRY